MKVCLLLLLIVVVGGTVRAQEADKSRRPILKGGFPAMSEEEWRIYDSLPTQPVISAKRRGCSSGRRSKN